MQLSLDELKPIIPKCRSAETSADPEGWTPENPSHMQCFNTAILLFKILGFPVYKERLVFHTGAHRGHCYNKDHNNQDIRLCDEQLRHKTIKHKKSESMLTEEQIQFIFDVNPSAKQRYEILKKNLEKETGIAFR